MKLHVTLTQAEIDHLNSDPRCTASAKVAELLKRLRKGEFEVDSQQPNKHTTISIPNELGSFAQTAANSRNTTVSKLIKLLIKAHINHENH